MISAQNHLFSVGKVPLHCTTHQGKVNQWIFQYAGNSFDLKVTLLRNGANALSPYIPNLKNWGLRAFSLTDANECGIIVESTSGMANTSIKILQSGAKWMCQGIEKRYTPSMGLAAAIRCQELMDKPFKSRIYHAIRTREKLCDF